MAVAQVGERRRLVLADRVRIRAHLNAATLLVYNYLVSQNYGGCENQTHYGSLWNMFVLWTCLKCTSSSLTLLGHLF